MKNLLKKPASVAFCVALFLRLVFLIAFARSPFFEPIAGGGDRSLYAGIAQRVAAGNFFPPGVFEFMPLYGWVIGIFFSLPGLLPFVFAGLFGCLVDSASAALVARVAKRAGAADGVALVAGLVYAFYPVAIAYSSLTMPNVLNAFLLMAFAAGAAQLNREASYARWGLTGLVAGVACLGFAGMLLVSVVAIVFLAIRAGAAQAGKVGIFVAGLAIPFFPVALHNIRAGGEFVLITAHGGFNFYMGNHEGATGSPMQIAGFRGDARGLLLDARREAELNVGHPVSGREFSKYWSDKAWGFIKGNPRGALRLAGLKALRLFNGREFDDLRVLPMLQLSRAVPMPLSPLGFGPMAMLAVVGLVCARRAGLLKAIFVAAAFSLVMFFITSRYRLTLAPLACALGAIGLGDFREFRAFPRAGALIAAAVLGLILALVPLPQTDFRVLDHFNAAAFFLERGMAEDGLEMADGGIAVDAKQPQLHFVRGNALFGLGRLEEAEEAYREALALNPQNAQARFNLAVVLKKRGDLEGARQEAAGALAQDPNFHMAEEFIKGLGP